MPVIECLIERDGPTVINDGGFTFVFKENDAGHRVCNVLAEGAAKRLLHFAWFRKYNPEEDYQDELEQQEPDPPQGNQGNEEPATSKQDEPDVPDVPDVEGKSEKELIDDRIMVLFKEKHSYRSIGQAVGRSATYVSNVVKARGGK